MIIKKIKLILSILFVVSFFIFGLNNNYVFSQSCTTALQSWSCTNYYCVNANDRFPMENPSYSCAVSNVENNQSKCYSDWWGGGSCVYYVSDSFCTDYPDNPTQPCRILNCRQIAPAPWVSCGGGTTPTITSTPTPTPTPTPAPAGGGVDCGTCKRGGESCSGSGSKCCSGVCKKNGTCAGGGGCGGGGTTPTNTPTPRPPTATPFIPPMATPTPTATPLPTATPTPVPLPWYKLKDASLIGNTSINNPIPVSPLTPYDTDDPGNRYLIDNSLNNNPGVVSGQSITIGGATVSSKNWSVAGKTYSEQTTISKFIDYVKTKKSSLVNNGSIVANKINILSGNQTISEATLSGKRPLMVIVEGNVTLTGATLNALNEQQIIMATGTITFPVTMSTANGLYIADSLDFGTTANQGIKIIGNIIAQSSFSNARQWSDSKKPGIFIIYDPSHYIGMLDMLSTITYDWRQIQ